jgi:hypothetical protein
MRHQLKWLAAVFAALLALCGAVPMGWAQTPTAQTPTIGATYFLSLDNPNEPGTTVTLAVRIHPDLKANGALTVEGDSTSRGASGVYGDFNPATGQLSGIVTKDVPPRDTSSIEASFTGPYDPNRNSFTLTFTRWEQGKPVSSTFTFGVPLVAYNGSRPYLVGIYHWVSHPVGSSFEYKGLFFILHQDLNTGTFTGKFAESNPLDLGEIVNGLAGENGRIGFERKGVRDGQPFEQLWTGQFDADTRQVTGDVGQDKPVTWNGIFVAGQL